MHKDTKKIKILDLFSGMGGFSKGFIDAGYELTDHYFSEVDKHAIANYSYNFKDAKYVGNIRNVKGEDFRGIDVITFGSPCQDFSIAGKRKGLEGGRSSLIREAIRIVTEAQPRIFIWENVKGTFSSNARKDFWAILKAFADIRGYRYEWQLLNTKWILPQNRERIYFVGFLTERTICNRQLFPLRKDDFLLNCTNRTKQRQPQTSNYCTTINPKFGSRASDTFVAVGDFRYDVGFRFWKNRSSPTIKAKHWDIPIVHIRNGCKKGYKVAHVGDSIVFSYPKSISRRGRVGVQTAQTIDTLCNIGVLSSASKIRRLTEIECERLQGFPDNWTRFGVYDGEVKPISKTQRYKLIGNAVTVTVVACIANKLKLIL